MPKLTNISGKDAVKAFLKFGYTHVHTSGDHAILQFLLKSQLKKANIKIEDYLKALKS